MLDVYPEHKGHLGSLLNLMERFSYEAANKIFRPGIEIDQDELSKSLDWFNSGEAERVAQTAAGIEGIDALFSFGRALTKGFGCIHTTGKFPYFSCWSRQLICDLTSGSILLDATADIDGYSVISTWQCPVEIPQARYDNLEILHIPQHTKKRLREYFKSKPNLRAYQKWMIDTIYEHMAPGETGLVVCKQTLFDQQFIPNWSDGDARFDDPATYTEHAGWELDGHRKLYATHWGSGVGSNKWKDATVVFLFDEFFIPRRAAASITQGYREHRANEGDLGSMSSLRSKAPGVDAIYNGHPLRHLRQMGLRGSGRFYDGGGMCSPQRLVIACDIQRLTANSQRLFPASPPVKSVGDASTKQRLASKVLTIMSKTDKDVVSSKELSQLIERPWRTVSRNVITPEFLRTLESQGWRYGGKGKLGARFERKQPIPCEFASEGILSGLMA